MIYSLKTMICCTKINGSITNLSWKITHFDSSILFHKVLNIFMNWIVHTNDFIKNCRSKDLISKWKPFSKSHFCDKIKWHFFFQYCKSLKVIVRSRYFFSISKGFNIDRYKTVSYCCQLLVKSLRQVPRKIHFTFYNIEKAKPRILSKNDRKKGAC